MLVNSLAGNQTVLYLPRMDRDRAASLQTVEREIDTMQTEPVATTKPMTVRRKLTSGKTSSTAAAPAKPTYTSQDVSAALSMVQEKWDRQIGRLDQYLMRNRKVAQGIVLDGGADGTLEEASENERPDTAMSGGVASLGGIMETVKLGTTPTVEKGDGLAAEGSKLV